MARALRFMLSVRVLRSEEVTSQKDAVSGCKLDPLRSCHVSSLGSAGNRTTAWSVRGPNFGSRRRENRWQETKFSGTNEHGDALADPLTTDFGARSAPAARQ